MHSIFSINYSNAPPPSLPVLYLSYPNVLFLKAAYSFLSYRDVTLKLYHSLELEKLYISLLSGYHSRYIQWWDSSYVSLTATCQGICFVHPVPMSTSHPRTSIGTKAATIQGKTSSEHKSSDLSGKIMYRLLILRYVDESYPYCWFVSLRLVTWLSIQLKQPEALFKDLYSSRSEKTS